MAKDKKTRKRRYRDLIEDPFIDVVMANAGISARDLPNTAADSPRRAAPTIVDILAAARSIA